jgi:serine/threonine protein kinase
MSPASEASAPAVPELPVEVGQILAGKYEVETVIGIGGMGVVVAARHVQLEQKVALKFLRPEAMQSKEAVERFLREARNAVRLRSEHVAKVIDVGTLETGAPYMVMEFLDGADLSQVVEATGSISIDEAVHFVLQASEAIAEAHSLGIIHRDLKPQNLFVTRRVDGRPLVKVLDFGISKTLDSQSGLSLTRTSSIMGSPLYMSPEQMRSTKNVDQRSDIWALGVILYELLTGRVPFEAEAVPELCLKVVQDPAEPPKSLRPEIPEGLNAVVLKCLEKDTAHRFANVAEFAEALEPYSPLARGASERIASTLHLPSRPPMVSVPAVGSSSNPKIGTGGTAWGKTQAVSAARRKWIPVAAGGAALAILGVVGIGIAMKNGAAAKADPAVSATAPAPSAVEAPTEPPSATAPPAPTAPASAAPAKTAAVIEAPSATAKPAHHAASSTPKSHGHKASTTGTQKAAPAVTAPPKTFE